MRNVSSGSERATLINYFKSNYGIDYTNPMPQIVDSATLKPIDAVYFTPDANSDLTIGNGDNRIEITGTITDSVGTRNFNEYVIAKPPNGAGSSKDFEGVSINFAARESDSQKEFTVDQFLELHGTFEYPDGSWVSPVVNWITDRLSGEQHPVIIEIKLAGFDEADLALNRLASYPTPDIDNPDWYTANAIAAPIVPDSGTNETTDDTPSNKPDEIQNETPVQPPANAPEQPPVTPEEQDMPEQEVVSPVRSEILIGTSRRDSIVGTQDDDIIEGGGHRDVLRGGDGADTFRFNIDALDGHRDTIRDFSVADGDKIDVSAIARAYGFDTQTMLDLVAVKNIKPGLRIGLEIEDEFHAIAVLEGVNAKDFDIAHAFVFVQPDDSDFGFEPQFDGW